MQRRLAFIIYHVAAHRPPATAHQHHVQKVDQIFQRKQPVRTLWQCKCRVEKSLQNKNYVGGLKEVIFCAKGVDSRAE